MLKLQFTIEINASREKVWQTLWDDATYREWTNVFSEGSYAVSDWKEGSKIQFLTPSGEGMYSLIASMVPNKFMSFQHLGLIIDGVEQESVGETEEWKDAFENYTLVEKDSITTLIVDLAITEEYIDMMNDIFPKALVQLKEIAEREN